jgi:hypothetical protein
VGEVPRRKKPVKFRRGRATVSTLNSGIESQTFILGIVDLFGTRDPRRSVVMAAAFSDRPAGG